MNLELAKKITGGLSKPSKMPCRSYNLPAWLCKAGSKLRKITNSVCSKCYALKGYYVFPVVKEAMERRFESLTHPDWVDAMVYQITMLSSDYFRWHDSGDIQDMHHLINIVEIARRMPETKFWLPTRETGLITSFMETYGRFPQNLVVRVSAPLIDGQSLAHKFIHVSGVSENEELVTCPSHRQDNRCGPCRKCWDRSVREVIYKRH